MMDVINAMIGFEGRVDRTVFWLTLAVLLVPGIFLYFAVIQTWTKGRWLKDDTFGKSYADTLAFGIAELVLLLVILYPSLAVSTKRLHDLDLSGWWNLPYFLPCYLEAISKVTGLYGTESAPNNFGKVLHCVSMITAVVYMIHLGFSPGSSGLNVYGPPPL